MSVGGAGIAGIIMPVIQKSEKPEDRMKYTVILIGVIYLLIGSLLIESSNILGSLDMDAPEEERVSDKIQAEFVMMLAITALFNSISDTVTTVQIAEFEVQWVRGLALIF